MNRRAFLIALLFCLNSNAETILGQVVGVLDGDTVTLLDEKKMQHRIRLGGIDAPEKFQAFGQQSKQSLSDLIFGREVVVDAGKTDRYGRRIGKILVYGVDANLEQVRRGFAWHYKAYENEQNLADRRLYAAAEEKARAANTGLWRDSEPIPPWWFRRHGKKHPAEHP